MPRVTDVFRGRLHERGRSGRTPVPVRSLPLMALMVLGHSVPARRMGPGPGPLGEPTRFRHRNTEESDDAHPS